MKIKINKDVCLLIGRVITGAIFLTTGWMKVSDMTATIGYFSSMGLAPFLAYFVGYAELLGGLLLVLGLWEAFAAAVLGVIMIVAIFLSWHLGFQAYGLPLMVLAGLVNILGIGAGKYAFRFKKSVN